MNSLIVKVFQQTTRIMRTNSGNVIFKMSKNPCEEKSYRNIDRVLKGMFDDENLNNLKSFLWKCPIKKVRYYLRSKLWLTRPFQGISVVTATPKEIRFAVMVPSFFPTSGSYQWIEYYQTHKNGKMETFLTVEKPFDVGIIQKNKHT